MEISRPESYQAYCNDTAIQTAVDHLLAASSRAKKKDSLNLPDDIEWNDLYAFHRAVLSAHQIRSEFAIYLIELWNAVWEPTLADSAIGLKPHSPKKCADWIRYALDTYSVWEGGEFYKSYDTNDSNCELGLGTADNQEEGPHLWFGIWNADGDVALEIDLDKSHWQEIDDEVGWFRTTGGLRVQTNGDIDITPLKEAAVCVVNAVSNHMGN